jgi:hypothetical protein
MTAAPAVLLGRCNPYGAETGGPRRILGGLHGPASARLPDAPEYAGIPESVAQGEWTCQWPAEVRVRMTCQCGHTGAVMALCSWHDETVWRGEFIGGGRFARVKDTRRVHGHYEEIQRRQAGACPRCLYPGKYGAWYKELFAWQGQLAQLRDIGQWYSPRASDIRQKIEDLVAGFDEGNATGTIHRCPMKLVPVS